MKKIVAEEFRARRYTLKSKRHSLSGILDSVLLSSHVHKAFFDEKGALYVFLNIEGNWTEFELDLMDVLIKAKAAESRDWWNVEIEHDMSNTAH